MQSRVLHAVPSPKLGIDDRVKLFILITKPVVLFCTADIAVDKGFCHLDCMTVSATIRSTSCHNTPGRNRKHCLILLLLGFICNVVVVVTALPFAYSLSVAAAASYQYNNEWN